MSKYVIVKEDNLYWAYRKIFGMWGIFTYVIGTCSFTEQECIEKLKNVIDSKKKEIVKEINLK